MLGRNPQVADLVRLLAQHLVGGHRSQAEDGARGADDTVVSGVHNRLHVRGNLAVHVLDQALFIALVERVALHVPLGQPDDAHLEALGQLRFLASAGDLDAAASDVDDHGLAALDVHAIDRGEVDEPGLFAAGNDARPDSGGLGDAGEELRAVFGLARGAGRRGEDLVHLVRVGQPLELGQRLQGRVHGRVGELAPIETAGAQAHHLLLPVDHLERQVRADLHDDHMDGIGADIDGGKSHGVKYRCVRIGILP